MYVDNGHNKHVCVLLIEDSAFFQRGFLHLLAKHHARVFVANNHAEAKEHIAQQWDVLDLILLDACVEPPHLEFDAPSFLQFLKELKRERRIPLRVLGFSSFEDQLSRMKRLGCTHTCPKTDILQKTVSEVLSDIYEDGLSGEYEIPSELKPA